MEAFCHRRVFRCDRLVVRTLRCGRNNPGSNPGRGMICFNIHLLYFVMNLIILIKGNIFHRRAFRCDRLVVRTLRCGRNNPGSNPGHGMICFHIYFNYIYKCLLYELINKPFTAWFSYLFIIFCYLIICHRSVFRCDRLVVRTLRCGRNNPGSNPGHGMICFHIHLLYIAMN